MELLSYIKNDAKYVWHPFTQMQTHKFAVPIVRGSGSYLYDSEGKTYIDAISSWWVNLHGHSHPYIVEKIYEQAQKLEHCIFAGFTHPSAIELAQKLLQMLPKNLSKVFYSDNGSTAVEAALKMAIQYWYNLDPSAPRAKVICFEHSYHGDTLGAMSVSGRSEFSKPFRKYFFDVECITPPFKGKEQESLDQLSKILEKDQPSCFIFEPLVLGVGGMKMYPQEGLDALLKCCKEKNVVTIADEVMTGFGRLGPLFVSSNLEHKPDIMCLSKGITGGFLPLGATVCSQKIYDAFLSNGLEKAFLHGHSYTANPLACASALASIELLEKQDSKLQRMLIQAKHKSFVKKFKDHPKLKRCESMGTVLAIEYHSLNSTYSDPLGQRLYQYFISQGILLRPLGNVFYVLPPFCITEEELEKIYQTIQSTLEEDL